MQPEIVHACGAACRTNGCYSASEPAAYLTPTDEVWIKNYQLPLRQLLTQFGIAIRDDSDIEAQITNDYVYVKVTDMKRNS